MEKQDYEQILALLHRVPVTGLNEAALLINLGNKVNETIKGWGEDTCLDCFDRFAWGTPPDVTLDREGKSP